MRLPNAAHESRPWRIREIVPDFRLADVWALPAAGGAGGFQRLLEQLLGADPAEAKSVPARALWQVRARLGRWLRLDDGGQAIPGTAETSLADRLPDDLRGTAADLAFRSLPFEPLFRTDDEFAAELANRTVHGVLHLAWVGQGDGSYQGRLAVYVKARGRLGHGYLALIEPFRQLIVYPALMRQIEREWNHA